MTEKSKIMGAGFRGRCPYCLEGPLFDGYLKIAKKCPSCGESFEIEDAGDGPAVFVIFIASILVVPPALIFYMALNAPLWLSVLIWAPILIIVCLALLRPFKGLMFAMQVMNKAEQSKFGDDTDHDEN